MRAGEALACARGSLSYAALAARTEALAAALRAAGVAEGAPVALLAAGALECTLLFHAAERAGVVLLPLHARLTEAELRAQLTESGVEHLVFDAALTGQARALAESLGLAGLRIGLSDALEPALTFVSGRKRPAAAAPPSARLDPERPLLRLFTSGTSGAPKAAELSVRALHASARGHAKLVGLAPDERWLACMPLYHVGGLSILARCALAGAAAELHERFDEELVCAALASGRIALVSLVPAMLARVLDAWGERPAPAALRCVLVGGAAAAPALLARGRALGFPLAPSYGLTEAASQVATRLPSEAREPLGARLRALPGTAVRIAEDGEILVRGPTLMTRYVGRPEDTARALAGGWLHTGDVGRLDEDGGLEVQDRRSDLIVSGGENVYPAEVEAALLAHPAVAEACVVGRADPRFGARPVAWLVLRPGAAATDDALRSWCRARLAGFKQPVAYQRTDALPRNAAGKLMRGRVRERVEEWLPGQDSNLRPSG
jgi:O-succinylbenzoic acid--CoA ligase